ncbi:MAG: NAD(P)-dependent oxidoreductase [Sphingobacteriia bacterium]|nr:NAD(P)-dependent oxidoreductase [Sphingobacteriia bacterium]
MKKVLIIGVNSFLGTSLIEQLKGNSEITGVYHKGKDNLLQKEVNYVKTEELFNLKNEYRIVYFISAFIPKTQPELSDNRLLKVNVKLLENTVKHFSSARFVLASSVSVYGDNTKNINERSSSYGLNGYGLSKLQGEVILKKHSSYSIFRISSMYGIGMNKSTFIPRIIEEAINTGIITLFGDGSRLQNYIHVSDVARMMVLAGSQSDNSLFLSVSERSYSNSDIAIMVKHHLPQVKIVFKDADNSPSYTYDAEFTYGKLNFSPLKKIEIELEQLIKWMKK